MASEWAFLQHEVAILKRMIGPTATTFPSPPLALF